MDYDFVKHNVKTGKLTHLGSSSTIKGYLPYLPEMLDDNLTELGCGIDRKDELIGDFMCGKGRKAVRYGDYAFYLDKGVFDIYGNIRPSYKKREFPS